MTTVAQMLVAGLESLGIERVWGVVGDALNPVVDALDDTDIEWFAVRHEEAAAYAAGAESQISGRLAVCAGTVGPGALHLVNGLADSWANHTPVLAITGQVPRADIGTDFHQEVDLDAVYRSLTVFNHTLRSADQIERVLGTAVRSALARRGPALLTIPSDLMEVETTVHGGRLDVASPVPVPDEDSVRAATAAIASGGDVTLLVGIGARGARDEVLQLADLVGAPVVAALRGKDTFEWDNPFYVGLTGLIGNRAAADAVESADVLVMIGTDFPYRDFLPDDATVVQIDIDPEAIGRRVPVDVPVLGDARVAVERIVAGLNRRDDRTHLEDALSTYRRAQTRQHEMADGEGIIGTAYASFIDLRDGRLHPELVARTVSELVADDAVVTADVGLSTVWAARFLETRPGMRLIGSFNHGSMANALPQALGAQALDRTRQVVALAGDGGLMMLLGDLRSAVSLRLPVTVVVFNNRSLGLVELEEAEMGIEPTGTGLDNPDFAAVGRALGLEAFTITEEHELEPVLSRALGTPGPVIVDVHTSPHAVSIPPSPGVSQAWGFATATVKELLQRD